MEDQYLHTGPASIRTAASHVQRHGQTLQQAVFAGIVDPGNLVMVREIVTPTVPAPDCGAAAPLNCDTAVFQDVLADYTITRNAAGAIIVNNVNPANANTADGIDTLTNIEQLQFTDQTILARTSRIAGVDLIAPTVALAAVTNGAAGTVTLSATAADNVGVASVQFVLDGTTVIGTATTGTAGVFSISFDTTTVANGPHTITAVATDAVGNSTTSAPQSITVENGAPAAPSSPLMSAATDTGSSSTDGITADSTPTFTGTAPGATSLTLLVDGSPAGTVAVTSGNWTITTATLADGAHTITAFATSGLVASGQSASRSITIDTTAPTAAITAPAASASVSGTVSVTGTASDAHGVANVQFQLDSVDLGAADATSPYAVSWNTTTATNGNHALSAIATDLAGNTADAAPSLVVVNNVVSTPPPGVPSVPDLAAASDTGASATDNVTRDTTPTFSGTSTNATSVAILVDGTVRVTGATGAGGAWTLTTPVLTNGVHAITARGISGALTSAVSCTALGAHRHRGTHRRNAERVGPDRPAGVGCRHLHPAAARGLDVNRRRLGHRQLPVAAGHRRRRCLRQPDPRNADHDRDHAAAGTGHPVPLPRPRD